MARRRRASHAVAAVLAAGTIVRAHAAQPPQHEWRQVTAGTLIGAGLAMDTSILADASERFTIVVGCSVATPTPTLSGALLTENIGIDARQPVMLDIDGTARQLPVTKDGLTPQNVNIAPGLVPLLVRSLSAATEARITFTDAFGKRRDLAFTMSNGRELPPMLSPCSVEVA